METDSKLGGMLEKAREWTSEQEWFQQLKAKWEELDPQSRTYAKFGAAGSGILLFLLIIVSSIWSVQSLKGELRSKQELLDQLQSSSDELVRLRNESPNMSEGEKPNWGNYFTENAVRAGIDGGQIEVSAEKPGNNAGETHEGLYDIQVKHISIKKVVRYALNLETGGKPLKLRSLSIDTKADPEGYMDATFAVSVFSIVASNK